MALPVRIGGFGGAEGLGAHLRDHAVTHLIDATHPFAAEISANAVAAAGANGVLLIALTRPPWQPQPGDNWQTVPDIPAAVAALNGPPHRVFLALGRQNLPAFATQPQHFYLLRLVDTPESIPLPHAHAILDRGPFTVDGDRALLTDHRIDLIVSKNSGGTGAKAKLTAARALRLPVLMIDRPALPARQETHSVQEVLDWVHATNLGV